MEIIGSKPACEQLNAILFEILCRRESKRRDLESCDPPHSLGHGASTVMYAESSNGDRVVTYKCQILAKDSETESTKESVMYTFDESNPVVAEWNNVLIPPYKFGIQTGNILKSPFEMLENGRKIGTVPSCCPFTYPRIIPLVFGLITHRTFYLGIAVVSAEPAMHLPVVMGILNKRMCIIEKFDVIYSNGTQVAIKYVDVHGWLLPSSASGDPLTKCVPVVERIIVE